MRIGDILRRHVVEDCSEGELDEDSTLLCRCHFVARGPSSYDAVDAHLDHVASVLAAAQSDTIAEARREAAQTVLDAVELATGVTDGQLATFRLTAARAAAAKVQGS